MGVAAFLFFFIKGLVWIAIFLGAGKFLRASVPDFLFWGLILLVVIAAGAFFAWRKYKKQKTPENGQADVEIKESQSETFL